MTAALRRSVGARPAGSAAGGDRPCGGGVRRGGTVGAVLMRDVSSGMLPLGEPFSLDQHLRFLDHMAALHAAFWGWKDDVGLTSLRAPLPHVLARRGRGRGRHRIRACGPSGDGAGVGGASRCRPPHGRDRAAPRGSRALSAGVRRVPHTLVHGDWKAANLGSHPDGRHHPPRLGARFPASATDRRAVVVPGAQRRPAAPSPRRRRSPPSRMRSSATALIPGHGGSGPSVSSCWAP